LAILLFSVRELINPNITPAALANPPHNGMMAAHKKSPRDYNAYCIHPYE